MIIIIIIVIVLIVFSGILTVIARAEPGTAGGSPPELQSSPQSSGPCATSVHRREELTKPEPRH